MIKNYLKIALRNLMRNRVYSAINILGLALGVACCLLLALYIQDEMSYDKHHKDLDRLYRIDSHFQTGRGLDDLATTSPPIAPAIKEDLAEVESSARLLSPPGVTAGFIKRGDNVFYEPNGYLGDSTIFDVLTFDFKEGYPKKALAEANTVVISERMSQKLFGNEPALNQVISISLEDTLREYKITGVIKDTYKSFIQVNFIISMTTTSGWGAYIQSKNAMGEWAGQNFVPAYLKIKPGHSEEEVEKKMNQLLVKYGSEDMKALGFTKTLSLEPVKDIYLKSSIGQSPRINYLYVIASIAVFILLIACINFMNLSTAKASKRANEVGLRKVMGAFRSSLIRQFMGEALVIVLISILLSVVMVEITLPVFNQLTGKIISLDTKNIGYWLAMLSVISMVTGIIAGSYPAFYLSSFQPAQVLKSKLNLGNASGRLRQSLVVFQFMIAIGLVCGMMIISQQLSFMQNQNLGFDASLKIVLPLRTQQAAESYATLRKELEKESLIAGISAMDYTPGNRILSDAGFYTSGGTMDNAILINRNTVEEGYVQLMDIKIIAGRAFNSNRASESQSKVIVNRTAAKKFGFEPEQMVGQPLFFDWQGKKYSFEVVGVMEDFHQTSLKEVISPVLFEMSARPNNSRYAVVKIKPGSAKESLDLIEKKWKATVKDTPFEYFFLDEHIQKQYLEDKKISTIITSFTIIAMFVSCLGLYGLSSYMTERRFKEIGIRKVMGASVQQIVAMMSAEFVKLVLIAFIIAVPVAWYGMTKWLGSFAYKVSIGWMVFALAGLVALAIALITISFESIKAAMGNPVESLRSE